MIGISRIAVLYSNIIFGEIEKYFDKLINDCIDDEFQITITPRIIQRKIKGFEDDFLDYPIQRFRVTISLKNKRILSSHPNAYDTTGSMWPFDIQKHKSSYITKSYDINFSKRVLDELSVVGDIKMELGVILDKRRFKKKDIPDLKLSLMSTIMHELNHGHEFWVRHQNKRDDLKIALSFIEIDRNRFTDKVYIKLNHFLYYIYWSLSHEQNAKVQEFYPYVLKYPPNELIKLHSFKHIKDMIEFDSEKYYNSLMSLIPKKSEKRVLSAFLKDFIKSYLNEHENIGESIDERLINMVNVKDIFKYYEKTIKDAGENMRRRILKQYSLKEELNVG